MDTEICAIDPGGTGGLAFMDSDSRVWTQNMPHTITDLKDLLRDVNPRIVFVEKVGVHMAGNNASSSAKFARHCGHIEGILTALEIPWEWITVGKWQKCLGAIAT